MRFQGENCTLSFGLSFDKGQVLLTGTIWPRRNRLKELPSQSPRLRFSQLFDEADLIKLQQWLTENSTDTLVLTAPIRQIRRIPAPEDGVVRLELDYYRESVPEWWQWEITTPLKIRLDVYPNEFTYLTNSLSRTNWSNDLIW
jgi:hypothetical protein